MCWGFGGDGDHVLEEEGEARKGGGVHWCNADDVGEYGCFQSCARVWLVSFFFNSVRCPCVCV